MAEANDAFKGRNPGASSVGAISNNSAPGARDLGDRTVSGEYRKSCVTDRRLTERTRGTRAAGENRVQDLSN